MRILKTTLVFAFLLALVSCGPKVSTIKPMNTDLSKYSTFAYLPNTNASVPGKAYNDENVNSIIVESIKSNMEKEGYNLDQDNPDLLVLISTKTNRETETTTDPVYASYPYSGGYGVSPYYGNYYYNGYNSFGSGVVGYDTDTYSYKEGTLVVNLVDRETKKTVWKGISSNNIYDQTETGAIQDMVDDIFKQYPLNN